MRSSFNSGTRLHFLSIVEVAAIPLHLAAGSPFDVSTENETTEKWLSETLLCNWDVEDDDFETSQPWWCSPAQQSDKGILLKVNGGSVDNTTKRRYVTEILIYAAALKSSGYATNLPTPPASSSPGPAEDADGESAGQTSYIKFYALPISSHIYDEISLTKHSDLPLSTTLDNGEGQFLSPWSKDVHTASLPPQKRQNILTKFEDATFQRKRLMRHGGEGVSRVMAGNGSPATHEKLHRPEIVDLGDSQFEVQPKHHDQKGFSSRNISPAPSTASSRGIEKCQPKSKPGAYASGKRSSLNRMESVASMYDESVSLDDSNNTEQNNKAALGRIIMAGMRIYGLQQRKKSPNSSTVLEASKKAPFDDFSQPTPDGEEYKLIYHQTFKAASFTFRAHLSRTIINHEVMRDVVDRHLGIFCIDPLEAYETNTIQPEFGRDQGSTQNSFEFPGTVTPGKDTNVCYFTPIIKKGS